MHLCQSYSLMCVRIFASHCVHVHVLLGPPSPKRILVVSDMVEQLAFVGPAHAVMLAAALVELMSSSLAGVRVRICSEMQSITSMRERQKTEGSATGNSNE